MHAQNVYDESSVCIKEEIWRGGLKGYTLDFKIKLEKLIHGSI